MITNNIYEVFLENEHGAASYGAYFGAKPTRADLKEGVQEAIALLEGDESGDESDREVRSHHLEKLHAVEELTAIITEANIEQAIQRGEDSPVIVAGVCVGRIHIDVKEVLYRHDFKIILPVVTPIHAGYEEARSMNSAESRLCR